MLKPTWRPRRVPTALARASRRLAPMAFLVAAAGPLLLLTYVSIAIGSQAVTSRGQQAARTIADESATFIQQQVNAVVDRVDSYGERRVAPLLGADPGPDLDRSAVNTQLGQLNASKTGIDSAFVTDLDGHLLALQPGGPAPLGLSLAPEEWYQAIRASGSSYVTSLSTLAGTLNPAYIGVATVLRLGGTATGRPVGYMVSSYSLVSIQASVDDFG